MLMFLIRALHGSKTIRLYGNETVHKFDCKCEITIIRSDNPLNVCGISEINMLGCPKLFDCNAKGNFAGIIADFTEFFRFFGCEFIHAVEDNEIEINRFDKELEVDKVRFGKLSIMEGDFFELQFKHPGVFREEVKQEKINIRVNFDKTFTEKEGVSYQVNFKYKRSMIYAMKNQLI